MAVDNSKKKSTPPRPNLPPEGQPWGRWVTDTLNELKLETGGVKREVISSNKNHNAQLQMSAQQKREITRVNLKAEEALNIALAASGSTTIYFVAPEIPEQGDIWYENVTGIWFRWVDDQWVPITDETLLEALEAILAQRIANDDKIRTFAQDTEPTGMTTEHVGDLWYDTDDKNKLYRWDGLEWVPIRDAGITEAQDAADAAQGTADDAKNVADDAKEAADDAVDTVSQLEAQVTADLGAMQGRLVTAEGELDELENVTLPALDGRLGDAESAVTAAEGRLVTAEGELTTLNTETIPYVLGIASDALNGVYQKVTFSDLTALQADPGNTYPYGAVWYQTTDPTGGDIIAGWQMGSSGWTPFEIRDELIANLHAGKITAGTLDADRIGASTITGGKILAGSITATHGVFATGAIQNADIGNLNASKINAGTLNAARIGADSIEGKHIKGGTITASDAVFATGAIQSADIGNLTADKITAGTLRAIDIEGVNILGSNTISGGTLNILNGNIRMDATTPGWRLEVARDDVPTLRVSDTRIEMGSVDAPNIRTYYEVSGSNALKFEVVIGSMTRSSGGTWLSGPIMRGKFGGTNVQTPTAVFNRAEAPIGDFDTLWSDNVIVPRIRAAAGVNTGTLEVASSLQVNGNATIDGSPIPRMATGSVYTGADPGAGNNQTHNISFPPGRFTSPPLVQVTSVNTFGRALVSVDNITTSGARVVTQRVGSGWGAGEIHWFATQS